MATMDNDQYGRGLIALLGASVLGTAVNVFFAALAQGLNPFAQTLFMVMVSMMVFGLARRSGRQVWSREIVWSVVGLNVSAAGTYILFIVGLKYLEPAIGTALQAGVTPLVAIVLTAVMPRGIAVGRWEVLGGTVILTGGVFLAWTSWSGQSGIDGVSTAHSVLGLFAVCVAGVSEVFLAVYAKKLTNAGWDNSGVLVHRFYLTFVVCLGWSLANPEVWRPLARKSTLLLVVCLAGTGVLLTTQLGLRRVQPLVVVTMTNLNPILTYLIQAFDARLTASFASLLGVSVMVTGTALVLSRQYTANRSAPACQRDRQTRHADVRAAP